MDNVRHLPCLASCCWIQSRNAFASALHCPLRSKGKLPLSGGTGAAPRLMPSDIFLVQPSEGCKHGTAQARYGATIARMVPSNQRIESVRPRVINEEEEQKKARETDGPSGMHHHEHPALACIPRATSSQSHHTTANNHKPQSLSFAFQVQCLMNILVRASPKPRAATTCD